MALLKPYDHGNYPQNGALGSSQALRTELDAIETGFDILDSALDSALTGASGSATIATTQAGIATTQAGIATTQAGIATTKASEALTSAVNANTHKLAAQSAQAAAEAARDSALSAYDNFDDRYLGPKASDPSLDNDGNPLVAGTLYFNTVSETMKLFTGTVWVAAYVTGVASNIGSTPSGNLSATNVQDALNELQSDIDTRATSSALASHISSTTAHSATNIANTPVGNISATNVQAAINELDVEKLDKSGGTLAGLLTQAAGADIASASTVDLTVATGNTVRITGTTAITAFTMNAGQQMELIAVGALPLTYNATTMNINGGVSYTCTAGDRLSVTKDGAGVVRVNVTKQDGTSVVGSVKQIQPITASVASNALTITLNPTVLDFRSSSLTSGTVNTRAINSAISTVISSGSTGGTVNGVQSRIVVLAIDNAGTVVLGWTNLAGGLQLDETNLITTTAEGGAGGADSANVIYTTVAVTTPSPYRVVGYVESTQATAGTWATAPSTIQGYGGQALAAMSSLGYGQTWKDLTGSRALNTTYYNTTGKPIGLNITISNASQFNAALSINGVAATYYGSNASANTNSSINAIIPAGSSYLITVTAGTGSIIANGWWELR